MHQQSMNLPNHTRGRLSDTTLAFFAHAFEASTENGILILPRHTVSVSDTLARLCAASDGCGIIGTMLHNPAYKNRLRVVTEDFQIMSIYGSCYRLQIIHYANPCNVQEMEKHATGFHRYPTITCTGDINP